MRGSKIGNEYAAALAPYADIPKAVFAALAYSFAQRILGDGASSRQIEDFLMIEWHFLHENGIVPQVPLHDILKEQR